MIKNRIEWLIKHLRNSHKNASYKHDLKNGDTFGVRGIMCNVYMEITGLGEWTGKDNEYFSAGGETWGIRLPEVVATFFQTDITQTKVNNVEIVRLHANGESFLKIADILEKSL